jgi:hypothetical protein
MSGVIRDYVRDTLLRIETATPAAERAVLEEIAKLWLEVVSVLERRDLTADDVLTGTLPPDAEIE